MFTIRRIQQLNATTMLLELTAPDNSTVECKTKLDHSLRYGDGFEKLSHIGGGVTQKKATFGRPPMLIETQSVLVHKINLDEGELSVDCELESGINTLLYPLGGLASGDMVYLDNEGNVYTRATAQERINALSLLPGDFDELARQDAQESA